MTEQTVGSLHPGNAIEQSKSRLKVLFFVTRDWYHPATTGGDNTLWEYARYLASVGHTVKYVAASYSGAAKDEKVDGIQVVRLGGIHTLWLRTFLYYMLHCRGNYDIVVAEGFGGSRIPRLAPLYVREPIVTAWHQIHRDLFATQYPKLFFGPLNLLERLSAWVHRDTLIQAYTPDWKEAFPRLGFKPDNIFILPVSIRDEWLVERRRVQPVVPTILWLGKVRRYKCPDHVIRAMPLIIERVPEARLVIAGRHDDLMFERELQGLVAALNLERKVDFRFNLSEGEKRDLLGESAILVLPSSVEGFGIVALEANACGVPVVASSGVPEGAVRDGYNGLRYPFGQLDALSTRLVRVLTDAELYACLSDNSLVFAKEFSWANIGARYEGVLLRLLADRRTHDLGVERD